MKQNLLNGLREKNTEMSMIDKEIRKIVESMMKTKHLEQEVQKEV